MKQIRRTLSGEQDLQRGRSTSITRRGSAARLTEALVLAHALWCAVIVIALMAMSAGELHGQSAEVPRSASQSPAQQPTPEPGEATPEGPAVVGPVAPPVMPLWPGSSSPVGFDWIQLKSKEWLKGELLGMYDKELEFDSDEMELQTFDWEDVHQVRTAQVMEIGLLNGATAIGKLEIVGSKVLVIGDGSLELTRSQVVTIAPWSATKRLRRWSGKVSLGLTVVKGNADQVDSNANASIKRRSARNRLGLDYIANVSTSDGEDNSNSQRFNAGWDHFITDRFFVNPIIIEWYRDPFQNLESRTLTAAGAGYQILDNKRTEWEVSVGLGYQHIRFVNVEVGEDENEQTAAFGAGTTFEQEWTKAIDFTYQYSFYFTNEAAGRYTHHMLMKFETEWTEALDFDVTFVWDRTEMPQPGADGVVPKQDDFRMVVGLGIEF